VNHEKEETWNKGIHVAEIKSRWRTFYSFCKNMSLVKEGIN